MPDGGRDRVGPVRCRSVQGDSAPGVGKDRGDGELGPPEGDTADRRDDQV